MLAQIHRFHGYNSLRVVYKQGITARSQLLNLKFATRDSRRPYRVAVVVSRKVSTSAVTRNRIRRRVYASVRRADGHIPGGLDMVFTAFSDSLAVIESSKLDDAVQQLLKKAVKQPKK